MSISKIPIFRSEVLPVHFNDFIEFDQQYMVQGSDIPMSDAPPIITVEEIVSAKIRGDDLYWLLTSEGQRVGYYWTELKLDCLFLYGLVISTPFKKLGMGKQVLHWLDLTARDKGIARCGLVVSPLNPSALYLYFSHGYQVVRCDPDYFGNACPNKFRLILEREIELKPGTSASPDTIRVSSTDYVQLVKVISDGYLGIAMSRPIDGQNMERFFVFQRKSCK